MQTIKSIIIMFNILLFGLGTGEIIVVLFLVLLLFGGKKLPELARGLGKGIREFKDASDGIKRDIEQEVRKIDPKE